MTQTLQEKIARIVTLDHIQLLTDYDVDADLYRTDPESLESANATADAILSVIVESVPDLEWVESEGSYKGQTIWCYDDNQTMWIVHNEKDGDYVWCECITMEFAPVSPMRGVFSTLEAAKAAAQADYTRRILSGIGLSTPEQEKGE